MPLRNIGMSLFDQALDHPDHITDKGGCTRLMIGRQRTKRHNIIVEICNRISAELVNANIALTRPVDDLVIHIGDVTHIGNTGIEMPQKPHQNVKNNNWPGIAYMNTVIDRWAAGIDADMCWIERNEQLFGTTQGVVKAKLRRVGHAVSPRSRARTRSRPMNASSGAISGPFSRPVNASRRGMNKPLPLALDAAATNFVQSCHIEASTSPSGSRSAAASVTAALSIIGVIG